MKHNKREKKKRKRSRHSTSSSSSSQDSNEWVEKSPPPVTRPATSQEKPPLDSSLGFSFLDIALDSSSGREKKEKATPSNKTEPLELPVGIYYPNRKQKTAASTSSDELKIISKNEISRRDKIGNRNFQKHSRDDKHHRKDNYSHNKLSNDTYKSHDRGSRKKCQRSNSTSSDESYLELKYKQHKYDKYSNSETQRSKFHKPASSSDYEYGSQKTHKFDRNDKKQHSREKQRSSQFRKSNSSDDDSRYKNRIEKQSSSTYFKTPISDDENNHGRRDQHDKQSESHKYDVKQGAGNVERSSNKDDRNTKQLNEAETSCQNVQVTHNDVNKIAAKLIKAEMMGNMELVTKLKAKLAVAKSQKVVPPRGSETNSNAKKEEMGKVVVVTEHNMKDRRRTEILERKKLAFLGDNNDRWVVEGKSFPNIGDEYEEQEDDSRKRKKQKTDTSHANVIQDHKRTSHILNSCMFCLSSGSKHHPILIEQYSEHVYLALPHRQPLVADHCIIVTTEHTASLRATDTDTYQSIRFLCDKLVNVFSHQGKMCVFFEMVSNRKVNHCHVHCIPLSRDIGELAPLYFQKSITDLEVDTRHNKTLPNIDRNKLCTSIPNEMDYFYVNFDWGKGYAHVIEHNMSNTFAEEIIGGMLDLSPAQWRNPSSLSYEAQMKNKLDFLNVYRK